MKGLFNGKKVTLEAHVNEAARAALSEEELFSRAEYDPAAGEKTGYSNYSYWRSTFKSFRRNKLAMALSVVLVVLLGFTFIQPHLPNQYAALTINNDPATGKQLGQQKPSTTTVFMIVPEGTILYPKEYDEEWYIVSNVIGSVSDPEKLKKIKNPKDPIELQQLCLTMIEYGEDWCLVQYGDLTGYIKNDSDDLFKIGDYRKYFRDSKSLKEAGIDPYATPYECFTQLKPKIHREPVDYSNGNFSAYTKRTNLIQQEDGSYIAGKNCELCIIPSTTQPFLFGTNNIGQDLWSLVWQGTRTSLWIGFVVALVEALVGILVGIVWGYVRSLDRVITEIYNVVDNIPTTIILILVSYIMRPGIGTLILAMSLTRWLGMARFVRNQIIIIRDRDYNLASRCLGTETSRIMYKNLLPYLVSVIMLRMALAIPDAIGSEVFITYIGLGLDVNTPSLGNLINEGRKLISSPALRYQLLFPAIVLSVITIAFYIIGNAFADAADPKNHL